MIGKQATDVWVLNKSIHIDDTGSVIPRDSQNYILLDDTSLPVLTGITSMLLRTYMHNVRKGTFYTNKGICRSIGAILYPCMHCHQKNLKSR